MTKPATFPFLGSAISQQANRSHREPGIANSTSIRVVLADDHRIVRQGLRALLEHTSERNFQIVGEADNGREVTELCRAQQPDVVVMDVTMPELNGMEATHQIKREFPAIKVVALSVHAQKDFVLRMLRAGATGYVLKESIFDELLVALKTVLAHKTYLSPTISQVLTEKIVGESSYTLLKSSQLTPREREVLQLLAEGKSNKEIAARFKRSVKTVEMHRYNIMNKLDLHTVAELTKHAIREGITSV